MPGRDLPDLEERLRRLPAALAVEAPAGLAERIARQGGRRRRLRRVTAAAVAVAVVGVVGVAVATRSAVLDDTPTPVLNPGPLVQDATPRQLARGHWQALPSLPPGLLPRRNGAAVVWTGQELIVWGGVNVRGTVLESLADGAAYNPRTRRWTPLPPAPESQWLHGDHGLAVWTGREVLVWGGDTFPDPVGAPGSARLADGVAYDPQRRTWRRLPARTAQPTPSCGDCWAVWTGRELVVGQVEEADGGGGTVAVAYDPAADRWRRLPPSPKLTGGNGHLRARTAMWAGTRLLVWNFWSATARGPFDETGAYDRPNERPDGIDLWAYDPATDRWMVLPAPPGQVRRVAAYSSMVWTGREVVIASVQTEVVTGQTGTITLAGRYDPEGARWTTIAPPPLRGGSMNLAGAGAAVVELNRNAVYDPARDGWLRLPALPEPAGHWPTQSWGAERALLRVEERPTGAIEVHVLVPAKR